MGYRKFGFFHFLFSWETGAPRKIFLRVSTMRGRDFIIPHTFDQFVHVWIVWVSLWFDDKIDRTKRTETPIEEENTRALYIRVGNFHSFFCFLGYWFKPNIRSSGRQKSKRILVCGIFWTCKGVLYIPCMHGVSTIVYQLVVYVRMWQLRNGWGSSW